MTKPNLWVDVDDTLILYPDDKPNTALIEKIKAVRDQYAEVYVWSGGGNLYAQVWAERLLKGVYDDSAGKSFISFKAVQSGDTCVDDMDLMFPEDMGVRVVTWQEFVNAG